LEKSLIAWIGGPEGPLPAAETGLQKPLFLPRQRASAPVGVGLGDSDPARFPDNLSTRGVGEKTLYITSRLQRVEEQSRDFNNFCSGAVLTLKENGSP